MQKSNIICAICIMTGLIVLGLMIPQAASRYRSYERTVSVKGLCEREVPADKVIWPIKFKVVGDDFSAVYRDMELKAETVKDFLRAGGVTDSEITMTTPSVSDSYAQEYGSNDRRFRYVVTCGMTVCSSDVDKVLKLMADQSSLIKKDIAVLSEWDSTPQFNFEGLNDIKPEMVEEATKNAREVAEKFAKDSGSKLGKIKEATQGTFSISDRDSNTPSVKNVRIVTYVTYYLKK